jgi:four helix bundle protein
MHDYHKLLVWQKALAFVLDIYKLTKKFPKEEFFGLTSQLRRAAVSVMANIVEGRGKQTDKDFARYLYISKGSLNECQCFLELAAGLVYLPEQELSEWLKKIDEIGFLLNNLINSLG